MRSNVSVFVMKIGTSGLRAMHASIAAQENAEDASAFDVVAAFRQLGAEIVEADVE